MVYFFKHVNGLTLKPLSETIWEIRIDAVIPLKYPIGKIFEAFHFSEDIDVVDLADELSVLFTLLHENLTAKEVLEFITKLNFVTTIAIALRILLMLSITIASNERSFSKLKKTMKNYLRLTTCKTNK